jgi:hypothetical protein
MRFTAILAALAAHGALAAPAPAAAPEAAAAAPEVVGAPLEARGKYTTAVSFGTFSDAGCSSGQSDHISADGECNHLPGQGLKIWWLAEGCRGEYLHAMADTYIKKENPRVTRPC